MSRPSFRPRPIDLTKPLPIVWSGTDLRVDDDVAVNRALPAIATGVDPSEETERHLKQALMVSVYGEKGASADIPIPVVQEVEPTQMASGWKRPTEYVMFDKSDMDLEEDCVEYDADHVDEKFVKKLGGGVEMDGFERAMDGIEKVQGRSDVENLVSWGTVKAILEETLRGVSESTRKEVYGHWVKRRTERGEPFLRMYQVPPDPSNNDPAIAFRPRDKEGGMGHRRMNTYDNYKRAKVLRDELKMLIKVLENVVTREDRKTSMLALSLLQQRLRVVSKGGTRIEAVNKTIFSGEQEPVVVYGPSNAQVLVPCRHLSLPEEIEIVNKRLGNPPAERTVTKKSRRKSVARATAEKAKVTTLPSTNEPKSVAIINPGVDTYGYDDVGNKFLKHMRYFAGGFMNYGVSPYDHRVFSASGERNTVRVVPEEPPAVSFPGPRVKFASLKENKNTSRGAVVAKDYTIRTEDVIDDIVRDKRKPDSMPAIPHIRKYRKNWRVRGRMGRGGRVILDRVVYERERGVKAASYPASVASGGAYTAGLPLDRASKVAKTVPEGGLGKIKDLSSGLDECDPDDNWSCDSNEGLQLEKQLIPALKPMAPQNSGIGASEDAINYWPRRSLAKHRGGKKGMKDRREEMSKAITQVDEVNKSDIRNLPAYASLEGALITEI